MHTGQKLILLTKILLRINKTKMKRPKEKSAKSMVRDLKWKRESSEYRENKALYTAACNNFGAEWCNIYRAFKYTQT